MLFVRSRNGGVSHRPEELTDEADIVHRRRRGHTRPAGALRFASVSVWL